MPKKSRTTTSPEAEQAVTPSQSLGTATGVPNAISEDIAANEINQPIVSEVGDNPEIKATDDAPTDNADDYLSALSKNTENQGLKASDDGGDDEPPVFEADDIDASIVATSPAPVDKTLDTPKPPAKQSFYGLDFRKLDKDLSPDEQREWNAIYASYRAGSMLTGRVVGVDIIRLGDVSIHCLVVLDYRIKVLIPQTEVWAEDASTQPVHVLRNFMGAEVDYIVTQIDREGDCVLASRKQALKHRRRAFRKSNRQPGDLVDCRVLAVSTTRLLLECGGYENTLSQKGISYGTILDLREDYRPGQSIKAVYKGLQDDRIGLSVKEVNPHPFEDVELRHPLHCRRLSRIMGKYAGGVFCELEKGFTCMCLYAPGQKDRDFDPGDNVIIVVTKYDYTNKLVYGRILSAW